MNDTQIKVVNEQPLSHVAEILWDMNRGKHTLLKFTPATYNDYPEDNPLKTTFYAVIF